MAGFELIEDTVLGSAAASIVFNTGLGDYTKFRLTLYMIKDGTGGYPYIELNSDSAANYAYQRLLEDGTSATGARNTSATGLLFDVRNHVANSASVQTMEISKPLSSTPARSVSRAARLTGAGPDIEMSHAVGEWRNTSDAISSIAVVSSGGNFAAGTRAVLEGLSLTDSITPSPVTFTWTIVAPSIALGASALVYQGVYSPQIVKKNVG